MMERLPHTKQVACFVAETFLLRPHEYQYILSTTTRSNPRSHNVSCGDKMVYLFSVSLTLCFGPFRACIVDLHLSFLQ